VFNRKSSPLRSPILSASLGLLLVCEPLLAYNAPLSDTTIREAYFLGQRRDETTVRFFDSYAKHPPAPKTGPYISTVQILTPFAQAVDLSRQYSVGYSAQQAEIDYRRRSDTIQVLVYIDFTATYNDVIPNPPGQRSRSSEAAIYSLRSPDFWRDFQFQVSQRDAVVEPRDLSGTPIYTGNGDSANLSGAAVSLEFAARQLASDDTTVEVDTPDGQQVVVTFDLAKLR
jgi:hypothetical protein